MNRRDFLKDAILIAGGLIVSGPLAACMNAANKSQTKDDKSESDKSKDIMKILIIESSPHKHGSSNMLADNFAKGAREAGHTVDIFMTRSTEWPKKSLRAWKVFVKRLFSLEKDGIETELVQIGAKPIRGCIACNWCKNHLDEHHCVFDDDITNKI